MAEDFQHLLELFGWTEIEVEKEQLSAFQFTAAATAAGQPLLADRVAEPRGQCREPARASLPCAS